MAAKGGRLPSYHILHDTHHGTIEAKFFQQYPEPGQAAVNSAGLLYKSQVLHVSKTSGASKEPELN